MPLPARAAASIAASITTAAAAAPMSAREVGGLPPSLVPTIGSGSVLHRTVGLNSLVLADCDAAAADDGRAAGAAHAALWAPVAPRSAQEPQPQPLLINPTSSVTGPASPASTTAFAAAAAAAAAACCARMRSAWARRCGSS